MLIVPFPVSVIPLLATKEKVPVVFKVPPLKIILSASADPGVAPILAEDDIAIVPAAPSFSNEEAVPKSIGLVKDTGKNAIF